MDLTFKSFDLDYPVVGIFYSNTGNSTLYSLPKGKKSTNT